MKRPVDLAVLDWGIGGLSVYNALEPALGGECSILYFSDAGATPYGKLGPAVLKQRLLAVVLALAEKYGVRHFVIACNAASTVLPGLQVAFQKRGLLVTGVIDRGVELLAATPFRRAGVIGGRRTILSRVFPTRLRTSKGQVVGRIAQPLSAMIERGELDSERMHATLSTTLRPLQTCDALLLACTHYPAIAVQISRHLPGCRLLDPAGATAEYVVRHWRSHWENSARPPRGSAHIFLTSGDTAEMRRAAAAAFGNRLARIGRLEIGAATAPAARVKISSRPGGDFSFPAKDENLPAGLPTVVMTESSPST